MESENLALSSNAPNIYVVGAQCTGKTTLVKALQQHFSVAESCKWRGEQVSAPNIIIEVARGVLQKHALTAEHITSSPVKALEMQRLILEAQVLAEDAAGTTWFIADRSGFDPIIYAKRYVGDDAAAELMTCQAFRTLVVSMRHSLVIVCEAGADWLLDDGVRLMPTSMEDWVGFHSLFCASLDSAGVEYSILPYNITTTTGRVGFVIEKWAQGATKTYQTS